MGFDGGSIILGIGCIIIIIAIIVGHDDDGMGHADC